MMYRSILTLLVVVASTSSGLGQVRLELKLPDGSKYRSEVNGNVEQTLTIAGMETESNVETHVVSTSEVGQRSADGTVRVKEKIESFQISMGGTAGDYSFDSANPDNAGASPLEMLRPVHKALAQRETTLVYGEDNRVQKVETKEDILASLPVQLQTLVQDQLDPEALKHAANQTLRALPDEPVSKGESWERTETANFGAGQVMTFDVKYTYEGTVQQDGKQLDKIAMEVQSVEFDLEGNPALPLSLKDSDLKIAESKGTLLFDRQAGQLVKNNQKTRITGSITFEANGQELPSELDLTLSAETTVTPQ